jgi:hypothetical protein
MKTSQNDLIIMEPYKQGQGIKTEVKSGFAFAVQKTSLVGLTVLMDAKLSDGSFVPKRTKAYLREDELSTFPWAKDIKTSEALDKQEFIIVPLRNIVFFDDLDKE